MRLCRDAGVVSRMELAAGLLRQGRATTLPGKGQSVEVVITLHTGGKRVQLQNAWRVALEPTVLCRLEDLLGPNNVRVRCSGPPVVERKPARRGRPVSV